jgi:predicted metal-binding membrane protein
MSTERWIVAGGVALMAGAAWWYTAQGAWQMSHMDQAPGMFMPHGGPWTAEEFWLLFVMWAVMMAAMMLPSAMPMILLFGAKQTSVATALFTGGYLAAWTSFSVAASAAQWGLHQAALLSPMMVSRSPTLASAVLLIAGAFQWTPWKQQCLRQCQSPMGFFLNHWRPGNAGAVEMGWKHGLYCMGCCWAVMGLLFVVGVMNLVWVAGIAILVLAEKAAPGWR